MFSRLNEYKVLLLRIFLAYLFYFFARVLFYLYNREIIIVDNLSEFLQLSFIGLTFDTSAILYVNAIFIIFSLLPLKKISSKQNQRFLFYLYFLSNSFFIGVKYKKTNIAPEFAIPNPSSTYNSGSIALGGESNINTMKTINNIRYICFPILLNL